MEPRGPIRAPHINDCLLWQVFGSACEHCVAETRSSTREWNLASMETGGMVAIIDPERNQRIYVTRGLYGSEFTIYGGRNVMQYM